MALQIKINGVDRSSWIDWPTLGWEEGMTKEPDLLEFSVKESAAKTPLPQLSDTVTFLLDGVLKFTGTIVDTKQSSVGGLLMGHTYKCKDRTHDLDQQLAAKSWENQTAAAILADINTLFTDGTFTVNCASGSPTIASFKANYEPVSQVIQKLMDAIGWDWYVDESSVIQAFPESTFTAPYSISDTAGNNVFESLNFSRNILQLKNSIFVQGGQFKNAVTAITTPDLYSASGVDRVFTTIYRYATGLSVTVDGASKTVGIDNLHDPLLYDVLYNFQEKAVKFRENNKPTVGQVVKVFGDQLIDLFTQVFDSTSVAAYGERQYLLKNDAITSIEEAYSAGKAAINQWASGSYEGSFKTYQNGFRPGQMVTIDSTKYGVNKTFKINKVKARARTPNSLEYTVNFLSSGQVTFVDMMVGLLETSAAVTDSTVIRRLQLIREEMEISDSVGTPVKTSPPYQWGAASANPMIWGFFTWS